MPSSNSTDINKAVEDNRHITNDENAESSIINGFDGFEQLIGMETVMRKTDPR